MDNNGQLVSIRIYNQNYNIRISGDDSPERMKRVAAIVDARMREIERQGGTADTLRLAILAALHIADELDKALVRHDQSLEQIDARTNELSRRLDAILNAGNPA